MRMKTKRSLYLGYYLKQLDREKFKLFIDDTSQNTGMSKASIIKDIIHSVFKYNISILEYFQFRFFELDQREREKWAGTGFMYEYQLEMNPKNQRHILDDKRLFYKHYGAFFVHKVADLEDLKNKPNLAKEMLSNPSGKLVFKLADGKCGRQLLIRDCTDFSRDSLIEFMEDSPYGLVEEFIEQHPDMNRLSPSAVNTVRIITQLNDRNEVDILGCRLRISIDSPVDNMAAGNIAAPINEATGTVAGPGVYSDITMPEQAYHPVTKERIVGFQVPLWNETLQLAKNAALLHPQNRSIGWDIVITERGPGLIEGNHDWCKLVWQLPVKKGMKNVLQKYDRAFSMMKNPALREL